MLPTEIVDVVRVDGSEEMLDRLVKIPEQISHCLSNKWWETYLELMKWLKASMLTHHGVRCKLYQVRLLGSPKKMLKL